MRIIRKYKEKEWRPKAPLESLGFARFRRPAKVGAALGLRHDAG
jgi:hypothetical protein